MSTAARLVGYEFRNVVRNRWVIGYALFFAVVTDSLLRLGGSTPRALVSLLNVVVLLIPLATITFGTIYWHASREFIELLLAQPVRRRTLFRGLFGGLFLPLSSAFVVGLALPLLLHRAVSGQTAGLVALMCAAGVALTGAFAALAVLIGGLVDDRVKGLALALGAWLLLTVAWDGFILLVTMTFGDYPLEVPLLVLTFANPVDLARVLLVLHFDVSALMGYTGAVFHRLLGGAWGTLGALAGLTAWTLVPAFVAQRVFARKDF